MDAMMRHDHTKWLMHFVRDRNPAQDLPDETEDNFDSYVDGETAFDDDAFTILKTIIRLGGLIPGYSFRNGRTTIYGGNPAVCATEMPLYSFAQYVKERGDNAKVSAYGIAFLKSEFYAAGGRPAIYGLADDLVSFEVNSPITRIFSDAVLPIKEQYRYVSYNPSSIGKWVDWSHEREWRWIAKDKERDALWMRNPRDFYDVAPGLPLFKGRLEGGPFTKVCIIVWNRDEEAEINELLTSFYLAKTNNYETPFDTDLIKASSIIVLEDVIKVVEQGKLEAQTIEGLDKANLLMPITVAAIPANAENIVADSMREAGLAAKKAIADFSAKYGLGGAYCGFAQATTRDVTNAFVQYMLTNGGASGPYDGRVWLQFPTDYPHSQSLDYAEAGCKAAAKVFSEMLGIEVYVETIAD